MKVFFATDLHGSDLCFRKFLAARAFYCADVLILGGDITGKGTLPLIRCKTGYRAILSGKTQDLRSLAEVSAFESRARQVGFYTVQVSADEFARLSADEEYRRTLQLGLVRERLQRWLDWATADGGLQKPIYFCPGNDDDSVVDDVLKDHAPFTWIDQRCVELANGMRLVGLGGSNPTPWATPREFSEHELASQLSSLVNTTGHFERTICSIHAPPYESGLDICPELTRDLQLRVSAGVVSMRPIGSTAVRRFIEEVQPLLGLFGHVHEARGIATLGRTKCVNPGSTYHEAALSGALVTLSPTRVIDVQFTCG